MKTKIFLGSVILGLAMSGAAYSASLQHAEIAFDGDAIASELQGAVRVSEQTTVYCQAVVSAIGATEKALCFNDKDHQGLADKVAAAVQEQDFWPAHVNGRAIAVRANFRVVLENQKGRLNAVVLPNLGTLQAQLGPHYVEPQERLDREGYFEYVAARREVKAEPFFTAGEGMVRVAATVNTTGTANDVSVLEADRGFQSEAKTLRSGVREARFIPGYVNGKPVEMPYLAIMSFEK